MYSARQSLKISHEEYFSQRTAILTTSIRPSADGSEFQKLISSGDPEKKKEAMDLYREGLRNGALAFIPSLYPSGIKDMTIYLPEEVDGLNSLALSNVSRGQLTKQYQKFGMIKEDEFAIPSSFLTVKFVEYLKKRTPDRYKVQNGTLNDLIMPIVIGLKMILKGRVYNEYQLYIAEVLYQVNFKNEPLIQNISVDFKNRFRKESEALSQMQKMSSNIEFRFNEPLPVEDETIT
jgi:hypothetical protein